MWSISDTQRRGTSSRVPPDVWGEVTAQTSDDIILALVGFQTDPLLYVPWNQTQCGHCWEVFADRNWLCACWVVYLQGKLERTIWKIALKKSKSSLWELQRLISAWQVWLSADMPLKIGKNISKHYFYFILFGNSAVMPNNIFPETSSFYYIVNSNTLHASLTLFYRYQQVTSWTISGYRWKS